MEREQRGPLLMGIFGTGLISFCGIVSETAINLAFPILMDYFHVSMDIIQWLTTVYLLAAAIAMLISPSIQKRWSLFKIYWWGFLFYMLGTLACSFAINLAVLLVGRVVAGLASGILTPLMFTIITNKSPQKQLGLFMSIGTMIMGLAPMLGPTYAGLVLNWFNWRMIFILTLPLVLGAFISGYQFLKKMSGEFTYKRESFDFMGLGLIFIGFLLIILGLNQLSTAFKKLAPYSLILVGILVFISFYYWSKHRQTVLFSLETFKQPGVTTCLVAFFLVQLCNVGFGGFLLPSYNQYVIPTTPMIAGLILLPGGLVRMICMPLSGRWLDHSGPRTPILTGLVLMIASMGLFLGLAHQTLWITLAYLLYSFGFSLCFSSLMTSAVKTTKLNLVRDVNALFSTVQQFSAAVGIVVMSTIVSYFYTNSGNKRAAYLSGGQASFFFIILALILSILLSIWSFYQQQTTK